MLFCILFLLILGNLQVIFQNLQNFLTFFNPILSFWISTITKNVVNKSGCIINIKLFKGDIPMDIWKVVLLQSSPKCNHFIHAFLLPTNIVPQVAFQPLIHPLYLAISLWMIACASFQICPRHFEEFLPKCTKQSAICVTNNVLRKPMQSENFFKK